MMRRGMAKSILVALVVLFGLAGVGAQRAQAAAPNSDVSHTTTKQQCVAHQVWLHGNAPADVKCVKWSSGAISPDTSEAYCDGSSVEVLDIESSSQGSWCFFGSGYVGLGSTTSGSIYNVYEIRAMNNGSGWVMYYNPPFTQGTGIQFGWGNNLSFTSPTFTGQQKITQVDIY